MFEFTTILISIGKAHLIGVCIVLLSYVIEKITGLRLLIDHYTWIKSKKNIEILSEGDSWLYVILNTIVLAYDIYKGKIALNITNIIIWLVLIIILTKIFYRVHKKYQKFDPSKTDDDYT